MLFKLDTVHFVLGHHIACFFLFFVFFLLFTFYPLQLEHQ